MAINTFSAFKSRNYRLYFSGQSVSLIGTWMQRTAVSWIIFSLTHSTFMLGLTYFAGQFPTFLLSLFGGVVSDRYDRYRVLLFTQIASMIQALTLAILVLFNHYTEWEVLALSVVLGTINAFDVPSRQALVYEMVDDKTDLPNALALNSTMVNGARLIGPAISGIVLEHWGGGICFLLNAGSFLAVICSLLFMKLPVYIPGKRDKKILEDLRAGFHYLRETPSIAKVILLLAMSSLFVLPFVTLLPVYAKVIFKGNATTFGYINSFIGLGAIGGALVLASLRGRNLKKILAGSTLVFGLGLILFSHAKSFPVAMVFATMAGFGMMSQTTISNTIIQTLVAPDMRGRVISYFAMAFFGMQPLGSLLIGALSQWLGTPDTILAQGIVAILILLMFSSFLLKNQVEKQVSGTPVGLEHELP
jgi:MFS family permease